MLTGSELLLRLATQAFVRYNRIPPTIPRRLGEMAEWLIALVLKTSKPQGFQGSNPCLSAIPPLARFGRFLAVPIGCEGAMAVRYGTMANVADAITGTTFPPACSVVTTPVTTTIPDAGGAALPHLTFTPAWPLPSESRLPSSM